MGDVALGPHYMTFSEMRTWKQCRWKHDLFYRKKLTPVSEKAFFRRGSLVHRYIELMYTQVAPGNMSFESLIEQLREEWDLIVNGPNIFLDEEDVKTGIAMIEGMIRAYHNFFFLNEEFEGIIAEKELAVSIDDEAFVAGKIDAIVKHDGKLWIHEVKTASSFSESDRRLLNIDEQITHYVMMAQEKYGREFAGGIRTVLKAPSIRQTKKETLDEYCARVVRDYQERPDFYLARIFVPRSPEQVAEHRDYVKKIYREIVDSTNVFRTTSFLCGSCQYFNLCVELDPAVRAEIVNTEFFVRSKQHQELSDLF